jgi:2-polyprenyl-3-methyl-5-hydroxy-6-metoxy-1,4-benzoquinol methylase
MTTCGTCGGSGFILAPRIGDDNLWIQGEDRRCPDCHPATETSYEAVYDPDTDPDRWWTAVCSLAVAQRIRAGESVLELGCSTGLMTSVLWQGGAKVTAVDRSRDWIARAQARRLVGVDFHCTDFGCELPFDGPFDHVVAGNVIGEVDDPVELLETVRRWIGPRGRGHVTTTNARSLHRVHGAALGFPAISDRGWRFGVRRVFTVPELVEVCGDAGLRVSHVATLGTKPWPNEDMARLTDEVRGALLRSDPPTGLGAMIYVEVRR